MMTNTPVYKLDVSSCFQYNGFILKEIATLWGGCELITAMSKIGGLSKKGCGATLAPFTAIIIHRFFKIGQATLPCCFESKKIALERDD